MVHFDAPYKGDKPNARLIPDQLGTVRDGVVEMRGHILQRHGPVIVIDEAEDAELVVIHTLLAVHASEDRFIGIAPEDLREQQRHQIIQKAPAVAVIQQYFLIHFEKQIFDVFVIPRMKQNAADRFLTVQAAHEKVGENIVVSKRVETVVQLSKGERSSTPLRVELDGSDVDFASLREDATYPQIKNYVLERFGLKVTSLQIAQTKRKYGLQVGTNHNVSKNVKPVVPQCPLEKETAIREALLHFQMI